MCAPADSSPSANPWLPGNAPSPTYAKMAEVVEDAPLAAGEELTTGYGGLGTDDRLRGQGRAREGKGCRGTRVQRKGGIRAVLVE